MQAFEQYTPFVNNYDASSRTLQEVQGRSSAFRSFIVVSPPSLPASQFTFKINICFVFVVAQSSRLLPESDRKDLLDLLITPIQRIPRYVLLLKDIMSCTGSQDPIYERLKEATMKMSKMVGYINETKSQTDGRINLFQIISEIEDCPVSTSSTPLLTRNNTTSHSS